MKVRGPVYAHTTRNLRAKRLFVTHNKIESESFQKTIGVREDISEAPLSRKNKKDYARLEREVVLAIPRLQ